MTNDIAGSHSQLTLEDLLAFPYFWKPTEISTFLKASWNVIKDDCQPTFTRSLNTNSKCVIASDENWVDTIGTEYWNILKFNGQGKIRHNPNVHQSKSVVELLRVIRNKHEHSIEYEPDLRKILDWFNEYGGVEDGKFVSFWMTRFPKLVSFLWVKFQAFKEHSALKKYYLMSMDFLSDELIIDVNTFTERLNISLLTNLESGYLLNRFKWTEGTHPFTLEFRICSRLESILDGNSYVRAIISSEENRILAVYHHYQNNSPDKLEFVQHSSMSNQTCQLIFVNNIQDDDVWKQCGKCDKLIVFGEHDKMRHEMIRSVFDNFTRQHQITDFQESPVSWNELSKSKQEMIFEKGGVSIQGRYVGLKDIISENQNNEILSKLSGKFLNQLMKQQIPSVFSKYELPSLEKYYVSRRVCVNGLEFFSESQLLNDIFNKNQQLISFVAEPGMGKSQLLVSLAHQLDKSLVIMCSMKNFVGKIRKEMKSENYTTNEVKVAIHQVLLCDNDSEKIILDQLLLFEHQTIEFSSKQVDLMLDGLDEVSCQTLALSVMEVILNEMLNIRLWITSRESFALNIGNVNLSSFCRILPFTEEDQKSFYRNYLVYKWPSCRNDLSSLPDVLVWYFWREVDTDLQADFGKTPLHCFMIAELLEEILNFDTVFEYGPPRVKKFFEKTEIFEALFHKKINVYLTEKEETHIRNKSIIKLLKESIFQLHAYLALKLLFPEEIFKYPEPDSLRIFEELDIIKMGIVTCLDPIIFIHRTFAEFMVARFIFQILEAGHLILNCSVQTFYDLLLQVLDRNQLISKPKFPVICLFLNEVLGACDTNTLHWFTGNIMCGHELQNSQRVADNLEMTIQNHFFYISWLILKLGNKIDNFYENVLIAVIKSNRTRSQLKCFTRLCDSFGINQHGMVITNPCHYRIFEVALQQGNFSISQYLIEKWFPPDTWHHISQMRENGGSVLHIILDCNIFFVLRRLCERLDLISYVYKRDITAFKLRDNLGRTPLLTLPVIGNEKIHAHPHIKKIIIEMWHADVNATAVDGSNGLYLFKNAHCLPHKFDSGDAVNYHHVLRLYLDHGFKLINKKCPNGCSLLTNAVHAFGSNLLGETLKLFKDAGADFNEKDKLGRTILHYCIEFVENIKFIELLITNGCSITIKNGKGQCVLCMAVALGKTDKEKLLMKILKDLDSADICNQNCKAASKLFSIVNEMNCELEVRSMFKTSKVPCHSIYNTKFTLYMDPPSFMTQKKKKLRREDLKKLCKQIRSGIDIEKTRHYGQRDYVAYRVKI